MLERTALRAGLMVLLIYFYSQPAMSGLRPAALDQSMLELRRTIDDAVNDGAHAYVFVTDLWTMRAVRVALQNVSARP
ncbi:MAG: hypothetical protein J0H89_04575 [Rhizobiales bacterium]|nr:hypothetical protein [Hyphomicrobiales bacterium]